MLRLVLIFIVSLTSLSAERRAKNIILFLGDAGGIPTLHAASVYGHNHPQKLFIQGMPYIALVDTSPADSWVTDSAAGMTAIVTGQKTKNGVISQSADAVRGKKDGALLKTILEHAEERGLSTGVVSNVSIADATPAACYAHANDRRMTGEIFSQVLSPRFGDGVDIVFGAGRKPILEATAKLGVQIESALRGRGFAVASSVDELPPAARRAVVLYDSGGFDLPAAVNRAISSLSQNRKGFFLMVECDMHTNDLKRGLDRALIMDRMVRDVAARMSRDTLILFTADHSFDIRVQRGAQGEPVLPADGDGAKPQPAARTPIRVDNSHTGEQVLLAAMGPGASRVRGFLLNTDTFHIMMQAYGWEKPKSK